MDLMKKRKKIISVICAAAVMMTGLVTAPDNALAAAKPSLSKSKVTLNVGKSVTLKVKNLKKKVTWKVKDSKIAKLSAKKKLSVKVKGRKKGKTTVTATYKAGKKSRKLTCKVTVKLIGPIPAKATEAVVTTAPTAVASITNAPVQPVQPTAVPVIVVTPVPTPTGSPFKVIHNGVAAVSMYVDSSGADYDGIYLCAKAFQGDVAKVAGVGVDGDDYDQDYFSRYCDSSCKYNTQYVEQKFDNTTVGGLKVVTDSSSLSGNVIIAGIVGQNDVIDKLIANGKLDVSDLKEADGTAKWETYKMQVINNPVNGVNQALVIAGSDMRGTIYGIYHVSELMGVSPWEFWADVYPEVKNEVILPGGECNFVSKEPSVKYRGIFLNDEAPSLSGWVGSYCGNNFSEYFYQHVYELILRCKGNYMWPAMWGKRFNEDGKNSVTINGTTYKGLGNAELADKYGIIMGTSHHEPMCRSESEWGNNFNTYKKYVPSSLQNLGSGALWNRPWDIMDTLTAYWSDSITRNGQYENIISVGYRGQSDTAYEGTVDKLTTIVEAQKNIISDCGVTQPKVITVYKEIDNYFWEENLKNSAVLDDVYVMLAEDNFGNLRALPQADMRDNYAGYGMYYHADYHGRPVSYEWVNDNPLNKMWEQMSMAYDYAVDDIWMLNVGDLKPLELQMSYFLDMGYDFDSWGTNNEASTEQYMKKWFTQQFGNELAEDEINKVYDIYNRYTKLSTQLKPEVASASADSYSYYKSSLKGVFDYYNDGEPLYFSVDNYNEAMQVLAQSEEIQALSEECMNKLSDTLKGAFYELVYYPAVSIANLYKMHIYEALNQKYSKLGLPVANVYATLVKDCVDYDKELTDTYNNSMPGNVKDTKWKGMMSTPHTGHTYWNSSDSNYVPSGKNVTAGADASMVVEVEGDAQTDIKADRTTASFADFTNVNKESYYIKINNGGTTAFDYTVAADDWLMVQDASGKAVTGGSTALQTTLVVTVDWSKVTADRTGSVKITGAGSLFAVNATAKCVNTAGLAANTFFEANDSVAIEAGNFSKSVKASDGASWKALDNYGCYQSAMKVYPTTSTYVNNIAAAPYAEYTVSVDGNASYGLNVYTAPTSNVDFYELHLRYAVSVDGSAPVMYDSIDGNFKAGEYADKDEDAANWDKDIKNSWQFDMLRNYRKTASGVYSLTPGIHTIRIYAVDPAVIIEKLELYNTAAGLKKSHLGPQQSAYIGKQDVYRFAADNVSGTDTAGYGITSKGIR